MHRQFVERSPFELHVARDADFAEDLLVHTRLHVMLVERKIGVTI
jgi:hypothetical protein